MGYGPATAWTNDFDELLQDEDLDAIVFASSELAGSGRALAALAADKHVFIDGALASSSAESDALVAAAAKRNRHLMAHSPALLRPGVLRLHRLIDRGALGEIFYVHARRYALADRAGRRRALGSRRRHDRDSCSTSSATSRSRPTRAGSPTSGAKQPDVIFAKLDFATGIGVYVHLSCLEGETVDHISVVGSEATAVLDATESGARALDLRQRADARQFDDLTVEQGDKISFRLPAEDSLPVGLCPLPDRRPLAERRFRTGARHRRRWRSSRRSSSRVLNRGTIETIAPRPGRLEQNVIAFRAR